MDSKILSLIRFVTRGFYSKPYVLILDAVLVHSVLSEDDLIYLLSIQRKELRSLCNRLVEDRLLVNHIQKEENSQQRLITRTYYYVHTTEAIDAIKWKIHSIVNKIKQEMTHYGNPQGYMCPRCGKKVSQLDAISLLSDDKTTFVCDTCGASLIEDDSGKQASLRQEKLERLMLQIDPIISYLKKIDDSVVTDNSFESALEMAIPAQSYTSASYTISNRIMSQPRSSMLPALSDNSKSQATLHVSITANDENYEREQQEREQRRLKLEQNALPAWHSASTVGKSTLGNVDSDEVDEKSAISSQTDSLNLGIKDEDVDIKSENVSRSSSVSLKDTQPNTSENPSTSTTDLKDKEAQDALATYYAQLAEREAEEDEDDDEDDDEFADLEDI